MSQSSGEFPPLPTVETVRSKAPAAGVIGSGRQQSSFDLSNCTPPMKPVDFGLSFSTPSTHAGSTPENYPSMPPLPTAGEQPLLPPAKNAELSSFASTTAGGSLSTTSVSPSVTPTLGPVKDPPMPKWVTPTRGPQDPPKLDDFPDLTAADTWGWKPNLQAMPFEPGMTPGLLNSVAAAAASGFSKPTDNDWNQMFAGFEACGGFAWGDEWYEFGDWNSYGDEWGQRGMPRRRKPRVDPKVRAEQKVFIGGLSAHTTAKKLEAYFSKFDTVLNASILTDAQSCRSRGFGFITFGERVPDGVVGVDHMIDGRLCGARLYNQSQSQHQINHMSNRHSNWGWDMW